MIETFRKLSNSFLAKILLGLVVASFAVWGVGDMLRSSGSSTVAEIGGEPISAQEFGRAVRRDVQGSGLAGRADLLDQLDYDRVILSRLAARKALALEARRLGFDGDDASVIETIRNSPSFRSITGSFEPAAYDRFLQTEGLRKREFEEDIRERIAGDLLIVAVAGGARQPEASTRQIWLHANETRDIAFATIEEAAIPTPETPDDDVLKAFHESEAALFTEPERRELKVLTITAEAIADPAAVEDSLIVARYESMSDRFNRPERRNLEQIVFADEAEAKSAAERAASGEPFTQIAAERGLEAADIALGYVARAEFAELQPEAADAVFAADPASAALVGPTQTPTGWSLVRIAGVQAGESVPLDEVKEDLASDIALEEARRTLADVANSVEDRRAEGMTFEEIAEAEPAAVVRIVTIDADGRGPDGVRPKGLPVDPAFTSRAFELAPAEEMDLAATPTFDFYAIEVLSVEPERIKDFDEIRAEVVDAWAARARRDALADMGVEAAKAVEQRVAAGDAPDAALTAALGDIEAERSTASGLVRGAQAPGIPDGLLTALFATSLDEAFGSASAAAAPGGAEWVVAVVTTAEQPDIESDEAKAEIERLSEEAASNLAGDLAGLYQAAVVDSLGFLVNEQLREETARRAF